nr:hypothetical protein [Sulfurimonas sp. MAG313]
MFFIKEVDPDKWKVFQALSINTNEIFCSDDNYKTFLKQHNNALPHINKESKDAMTESYIMLDPFGRFYQNSNHQYVYSKSILDVNVEEAFEEVRFNRVKFDARYHNDITKTPKVA